MLTVSRSESRYLLFWRMVGRPAMNRKILVLCAGEQERWGDYTGVPKYLVKVHGQSLPERNAEFFGDELLYVLKEGLPIPAGTRHVFVEPTVTGTKPDKFLSSRYLWNNDGVTVLLFGDVWLSRAAAREILCPTAERNIRFIGRLKASSFTGCRYGEIFAVIFGPESHTLLDDALQKIRETSRERPSGWLLYQELLISSVGKEWGVIFSHVDDFTEDFDFPSDHESWLNAHAAVLNGNMRASMPKRKRRWLKKTANRLSFFLAGAASCAILAALA